MNIVFMNGLFGVDLRHPLSGSELPVNVVPQIYIASPHSEHGPLMCVCTKTTTTHLHKYKWDVHAVRVFIGYLAFRSLVADVCLHNIFPVILLLCTNSHASTCTIPHHCLLRLLIVVDVHMSLLI